MHTSFDTHSAVKHFILNGIKEKQAEAIVEIINKSRDNDLSHLATKVDVLQTEKRLDAKISAIKLDVSVLQNDVTILKTDVAELKTDVAELKTDVAELKTDVAELKTDVAGLKTDVAELKTDVIGLKTDVAGLKISHESLRSEFKASHESLRSELLAKIAESKYDMIKWYIGTSIATISIIVGILKFSL